MVRSAQPGMGEGLCPVRKPAVTTDREFAEYLRSLPREIPAAEVREIGRQHDNLTGPWTGNQIVHHGYGEARQ